MDPNYSDQSRDRRIEDPTNLWVVHPASRALLPFAVRRGISANSVSLTGLAVGALAALALSQWPDWRFVGIGFLLCIGWLIADGLDGMIARATGTASAVGRILDGLCDHGVFAFLYVSMALSIGTVEGWILGWVAAAFHAVQSSLYEGERLRYHRRLKGDPLPPAPLPSKNPLVRLYERVANSLDRPASLFDAQLARSGDPSRLIQLYREAARRPMKLLSMMSANVRVIVLALACLAGNPMLFWWVEIIPLSGIALAGILWHRAAERLSVRLSGV